MKKRNLLLNKLKEVSLQEIIQGHNFYILALVKTTINRCVEIETLHQ